MLPNPLRRVAMLIGALSLLAVAGPVASASAVVESSQITSPAGPTYALNDESESSPQPAFKVEGTTNLSGKLAIRCYFGTGSESYATFVNEVEISGGAFSATVEPKSLSPGQLAIGPCVLRAVPVGNKESHPPGTSAEETTDPFKGPRIVGSRFQLHTEGINYDYEFEPNALGGYLNITSAGDCGLSYSNLWAPETLVESEGLFDCNAFLYLRNYPASGEATRSELQIDGANAYSPATAHYLENELKVKSTLPGAPQATVEQTFERLTGLITVKEVDPIVKCSPETVFPPTVKSCTAFVSTGVQLERTWKTSNANQVAWLTDAWRSTDGAAHSLNALYNQETANDGKAGGAYEFPGTNVFAATSKGQTVTLPPGLGRVLYKEDAETPSEGDGEHPQGAIVYDTPPSGAISVYRSTAAKEGYNGFEMPYQGTIPAGGSYVLNMAFIQAYKLPEVETLTSGVLAGYPPSSPPSLTITSPASSVTVTTPTVTVSGTVSDTRVITSFTVDGKTVGVAANGAWSTSVALNKGANTIEALAIDQAGFSTEKSVSVTYTPPPPPSAHTTQVGSASGANGQVRFMILCTGPAGTSCEIEALLTTVEKTHNGRLIAVSARRHHHGTRSTRVTVGSSKLTILAGQRVTVEIPLNATGQSLLAQFGKLPVHLTVVQTSAGHRSTVIAQNLTVTPHRKPRHHHHHHRHHHRH